MKPSRISSGWLWATGLALIVVGAVLLRDRWWPRAQSWVQSTIAARRPATTDAHASQGEDEHGHDDHGHSHDDPNLLELSEQARANLGLTAEVLKPITLETFRRAITVPAIVTERPGRTRVQVSTPIAGVITHVHAVQGEAVAPGTLLFQLRITAEELVESQTSLLKSIGELDVENREITRLQKVSDSGAVPLKSLLERQYAKEKLDALIEAQKEALRLHGLSDRQIDEIAKDRRLLKELQIVAPQVDDHSDDELKLTDRAVPPETVTPETAHGAGADASPLVLKEVRVHKGQTVAAGETLAILADYSELYIEGQAFEQDLPQLSEAAQKAWKVSALFEEPGNRTRIVDNLDVIYASSEIDVDTRTLPFYVRLPNAIARSTTNAEGQRFLDWQYRMGQRLQLRLPVEEWPERIVLPVDAVARDGAESYVFRLNGDHFDRISVKVDYRDPSYVVIANNGAVFPGNVVALRGAHQMLMALKNKSGGGVDPHAGHNH